MSNRNLMNRRLRTQVCAVAVVLIMVASAFVFVEIPDRSVGEPVSPTNHSITYHYDNIDTVNPVSVTYYGIAATEYNPEFWSGTVDGVSVSNWSGPSTGAIGISLSRTVIGAAADFTYHLKRTIEGDNQNVFVTVGNDFTATLVQYTNGGITYPLGTDVTIITLNGVVKDGVANSNGYKVQFPGSPEGQYQSHFDIVYEYDSSEQRHNREPCSRNRDPSRSSSSAGRSRPCR